MKALGKGYAIEMGWACNLDGRDGTLMEITTPDGGSYLTGLWCAVGTAQGAPLPLRKLPVSAFMPTGMLVRLSAKIRRTPKPPPAPDKDTHIALLICAGILHSEDFVLRAKSRTA